ncbi:uncharacterized protein LOC129612385 [Condylostylus longicornis]|uniref:uncharacterized protein LOC129612385 n=1 Tax=Condylostylus longicornis TaxID=2530218 RepID=UPI00244E0257|nr:uncharacterized protein LOC129612385 [Condylostylus longicornis]
MATTIQQQPSHEQSRSNPQLKRLVYSKYREMLGNYNDKANTIIQSLPTYMVTEDKGFNFDHINDISTLNKTTNGNHNGHHQHHGQNNNHHHSNYNSIDVVDKEARYGQAPPACVQNAMMTKDKKPFTYTPSGIDLSQIKSPRMAKRIARNAQMEGVSSQPKPSPLAAQNNSGNASTTPPIVMGAQAVGMPVQVFPTGPPPPPPPQKSAGAPPPPPPPGKNTLSPQQNGAGARKSPSPLQKFEPPPMGCRPEIKIPPNPMANLRKVPKPKEKNDFWIEEYRKEKSGSPMPMASGSVAESASQYNYNRTPSPSPMQQHQEQYRAPSPSRFVQQQHESPQSSTPYSPMKSPGFSQQQSQPQQFNQNYSTTPLKTPAINQLSLYDQDQQQNRGQSPLRSPGVQQTQQYDLNRESPIKSPAISQIQNQYQQQLARSSQSPQRTQIVPQVQGRVESPFHTPKEDNVNLQRSLSPVRVNSNTQSSPQQQHPTQYPYGRTSNVTSPTQKDQQEQQPLSKASQVGSLYIPPVAPENLAVNQQQSNNQGSLRKGPPPNRWVTPTKDVPDWARQNDTTKQQNTPSRQEQPIQQQYNSSVPSPSNKWPQQQQYQQPSHLQQNNPGLKLQMNNPPLQTGTQPKEHIIPIQIERTPTSNPTTPGFPGSNPNSSTPGSAGSPGYIVRNPNQFVDQGYQNYPGQQPVQQNQQAPGTRIIPISIEGQQNNNGSGNPFNSNSVRGPVSQQPMVIQNGNYRIFVHDIPLEAEIRYRKSRLSDPRTLQHQNSWGGSTSNGPSQSKSFRILQKITSTEDSDDSSNRSSPAVKTNFNNSNDQPPQLQRPHYSKQMSQNGLQSAPNTPQSPYIDNEQLKRMQINEQDHLNFMNRVRSQDEDTTKCNADDFRYRGTTVPSHTSKLLQDVLGRKMKEESFDNSYNGGDSIDPYIRQMNGTPPIMRQPQPPRYTQQPGGFYNDDYLQQQYVHPSEQRVPEPKKYTGSAIPSRSFKLLQQMTTPENAVFFIAEMEGSDVEHEQISSNSSYSSPNNDNNDNTDNNVNHNDNMNNEYNHNNHNSNNNNDNNNNTNYNNNNNCSNNNINNNNNNNRAQPSPTPLDPPNYPYPYPPYPPYGYPGYPPPYQFPPQNLQSHDMKNWPYPPPPYPYYYHPYYPPPPHPLHPPHHIPPDYDPQNFNNSFYNSNGSLYGSYDSNAAVRRRRNLARSRNGMNNAITNGWRNSAPPNIIVTQSFDETEEEEHMELEKQNYNKDELTARGYRASSVIVDSNCQKPNIGIRSSSEAPEIESINAKEIISRFNNIINSDQNNNQKFKKNSDSNKGNNSSNDSKDFVREDSVIDELSAKLDDINSSDTINLNISKTNNKTYLGESNKSLSKSCRDNPSSSHTPSPNLNSSSSNSPISNFTQSDNEIVPVPKIMKTDKSSSEEESFSDSDDSEESSFEEYEEPVLCSNKSVRDIQTYNTETDEDPTTENSKILDQDDLGNETEAPEDPFCEESFKASNEKIDSRFKEMFDEIESPNSEEDEIQFVFMKDGLEDIGEEEEDDKNFSGSDTVEALDNDDKTVEDLNSGDETYDEEDLNLVSVRLPLKLSFSRSENDENVTTVEVGTSEIKDSSSRRSSIVSIKDDLSDFNALSPRSSLASTELEHYCCDKSESRKSSISDIKDQLKRISCSFDFDDTEMPIDLQERSEKVSLRADLQETNCKNDKKRKNSDDTQMQKEINRRFSITSISAVDSDDCDVSVTVNLSTVRSGSNVSEKSHEANKIEKSRESVFKKEDSVVTDEEEVSVSFSLNMRNKFLNETYNGDLTNNIAKSDSQSSSNDCVDLVNDKAEVVIGLDNQKDQKKGSTSESVQTTWEEHSKVTSMLIAKWAYNNRDLDDEEGNNQVELANDAIDFCGTITKSNTTDVETTLDLSTNVEENNISEEDGGEIDFWANIKNHDDDGFYRAPIVHNESTDDFCSTKTITQNGDIISQTSTNDIQAFNESKKQNEFLRLPNHEDISADLWTTSEKVSKVKNVKMTDNEDNIDFWSVINNEEENKTVQVTKNESGANLLCNKEYANEKKTFAITTQNSGNIDFWQTCEKNKEIESRSAKLDDNKTEKEEKEEEVTDFWSSSKASDYEDEAKTLEKHKVIDKTFEYWKSVDEQRYEETDMIEKNFTDYLGYNGVSNDEVKMEDVNGDNVLTSEDNKCEIVDEARQDCDKKAFEEMEYEPVIDFWGNYSESNTSKQNDSKNIIEMQNVIHNTKLGQNLPEEKRKKLKSDQKQQIVEGESNTWVDINCPNVEYNIAKEYKITESKSKSEILAVENALGGSTEIRQKHTKSKKKRKESESETETSKLDCNSLKKEKHNVNESVSESSNLEVSSSKKDKYRKSKRSEDMKKVKEFVEVSEKGIIEDKANLWESQNNLKNNSNTETAAVSSISEKNSSEREKLKKLRTKDEARIGKKSIESNDKGIIDDNIDFWAAQNALENKINSEPTVMKKELQTKNFKTDKHAKIKTETEASETFDKVVIDDNIDFWAAHSILESKKNVEPVLISNVCETIGSKKDKHKKCKSKEETKERKQAVDDSDKVVIDDNIDFWAAQSALEEFVKSQNPNNDYVDENFSSDNKIKKQSKLQTEVSVDMTENSESVNEVSESKEGKKKNKKSKKHRNKHPINCISDKQNELELLTSQYYCPAEEVQYFGETNENKENAQETVNEVVDNEIDFNDTKDYFEQITNKKVSQNSKYIAIEPLKSSEKQRTDYNQESSTQNEFDCWNSLENNAGNEYCYSEQSLKQKSSDSSELQNCEKFLQDQSNQCNHIENIDHQNSNGFNDNSNFAQTIDKNENKEECRNNYKTAMNYFKRRSSIHEEEEKRRRDRSTSRYDDRLRRDSSTTRYDFEKSRKESNMTPCAFETLRADSNRTVNEYDKLKRGSSITSSDCEKSRKNSITNQNDNMPKMQFHSNSYEPTVLKSNSNCYQLDKSRRSSSINQYEATYSTAIDSFKNEFENEINSKENCYNYYNTNSHEDEDCEEIEIEIIHECDDNKNTNNLEIAQEYNNENDISKASVRHKIMAFETGTVEQTKDINKLDIQTSSNTSKENSKDNLSRTSSLQRSESEIDDDSGVTDMSKLISETDTESECFPELRKMSRYERAATHSRLFRLLTDESEAVTDISKEQMTEEEKRLAEEFNCKPSKKKIIHNVSITRRNNPDAIKQAETMSQRRERLSLPLKASTSIDSDNLSTSNSPMSPATSTNNTNKAVSDQLVNELIQSLMLKTSGNQFKHLPMERIQAAAKRVLEEHLDSLDNTSLESTPALTPQEFKTDSYSEYYDSWSNKTSSNNVNSSSTIRNSPKTIKKPDVENKLPTGIRRGRSIARCPRVISSKTVNTDLTRISESPDIFRANSMTRSSIERDSENAFKYVRSNSITRWGKV